MRKKTNILQNQIFQLLIIPLGLIIVWKLYRVYKTAGNTAGLVANSIKNDVTGSVINAALKNTGLSPIRSSAVSDIVENIYAAFYKDSFFGMGEDEQKAVENFNQLQNSAEAKAAAIIYKANFKKSLFTDMNKYCNGENFKNIKASLLNAVK